MTLIYKADVRSLNVAVIMDRDETSTFSATISDDQLFRWDRIFEDALSENSPHSTTPELFNASLPTTSCENLSSSYLDHSESMETTSQTPSPKSSNPLSLWYWCIFIIIGAIFFALIITLGLVYRRAHSELTRLLAVQTDVERGMFIFNSF